MVADLFRGFPESSIVSRCTPTTMGDYPTTGSASVSLHVAVLEASKQLRA